MNVSAHLTALILLPHIPFPGDSYQPLPHPPAVDIPSGKGVLSGVFVMCDSKTSNLKCAQVRPSFQKRTADIQRDFISSHPCVRAGVMTVKSLLNTCTTTPLNTKVITRLLTAGACILLAGSRPPLAPFTAMK